MNKKEIEKKTKIIDLKIENLKDKKEQLLTFEKIRKEYTTREAISLMKQGKIMAMGTGHIHNTGYFYEYSKGMVLEHNGDGTIYHKHINPITIHGYKEKEKFWVIVTKKDLEEKYEIEKSLKNEI